MCTYETSSTKPCMIKPKDCELCEYYTNKQYNENDLDYTIQIALINMYTLIKQHSEIELINFDSQNKNHLALLHIAKIAQQNFITDKHSAIYIYMPFLKYIFFKIKNHKHFKMKYCLSTCESYPTCSEFISFITNNNNSQGIFAEIYKRYYENV